MLHTIIDNKNKLKDGIITSEQELLKTTSIEKMIIDNVAKEMQVAQQTIYKFFVP